MSSMVSTIASAGDPAAMLNMQLASALSTVGDAQYWEENISPTTIRTSLAASDPSNPNSTPALLKGMKWLLASISKGRDVSDFYPHVVKQVGAHSLEARKMVYMYLVQYADHDATTRELSLLSINSFQRGLADSEQLIRALALRVLTSIRIPDILQIQILGVQKCSKDSSPYVRKCAANALAKLSPRCDTGQLEMLLEIMACLLNDDSSTMVLTSSLVAFGELCPDRLELLHGSFRKICHLLTDMDEWGQVIVIDTMARYCRRYFREPKAWKQGTAEKIDRERRVRRTLSGIANEAKNWSSNGNSVTEMDASTNTPPHLTAKESDHYDTTTGDACTQSNSQSHGSTLKPYKESDGRAIERAVVPKKVKRRIVKKGFYSDEEDDSTEEERYEGEGSSSLAGAMRQSNVVGAAGCFRGVPAAAINEEADEDDELNEDHRLLLRSAMPLLKSRNAGVVLAVCSLQYYCGVSSVKVRSSIGKALVRIHRDRREIQYVVLSSIRTLVHECPSAFAPFLQDFFVVAMDPSFTRLIKLEILTSLALEPASIEAVLNELRTYVRHGDKQFACAAVQAVGTVSELARIVHDRHGAKTANRTKERSSANNVTLDCLHGLTVLTRASLDSTVVGECVSVMQRLLLHLSAEDVTGAELEDPNHVRGAALQRILLLLLNSLMLRSSAEEEQDGDESTNEHDRYSVNLKKVATVNLPSKAFGSALWIAGEWSSPIKGRGVFASPLIIRDADDDVFTRIRLEICRLLSKSFMFLDPLEKEQAVSFAAKVIVASKSKGGVYPSELAFCESILALGRIEVIPDVRDRARYESNLIHLATGLQFDREGIESIPVENTAQKPSLDNLNGIFLQSKPASSSLLLEDVHYKQRAEMGEKGGNFRFGTLSSLVGHRARSAYIPLPRWALEDTSSSARDPQKKESSRIVNENDPSNSPAFYDDSTNSDSHGGSIRDDSNSDSESESSLASSSSDFSPSDGGNSSSSTDGSAGDNEVLFPQIPRWEHKTIIDQATEQRATGDLLRPYLVENSQPMLSSEDSSGSSESGSESSSRDDVGDPTSAHDGEVGDLIPMGGASLQHLPIATRTIASDSASSLPVNDMKGLVLEPLVLDVDAQAEPNFERDSSPWFDFVGVASGGGVSVKARYLRGKTKDKEMLMLGLLADKTSAVCLQVRFENRRTDGSVLRRLRVVQRSSTASSSQIGPKKVVVPREIAALEQGQMASVVLGVQFTSSSDRDDSLSARFEIKYNGGTFPIEIRPCLLQLLQPCVKNRIEFDSGTQRLQGFNRVDSSFTARDASTLLTKSWMRKNGNLTPIKESTTSTDGLRFAASLPASGDPVFVLLCCTSEGGTITVWCGQALAVNGIVNVLKKAIIEATSYYSRAC